MTPGGHDVASSSSNARAIFVRVLALAPVDVDPEELRSVQPFGSLWQVIEVIDLVTVEQHCAHCVGFLLTGACYPTPRALKRAAHDWSCDMQLVAEETDALKPHVISFRN